RVAGEPAPAEPVDRPGELAPGAPPGELLELVGRRHGCLGSPSAAEAARPGLSPPVALVLGEGAMDQQHAFRRARGGRALVGRVRHGRGLSPDSRLGGCDGWSGRLDVPGRKQTETYPPTR